MAHGRYDPTKKIAQLVVPVCDATVGRLKSKAEQLRGHPCPRVLALTGSTALSHVVMVGDATEEILAGEQEMIHDQANRIAYPGTRFRYSAFLQQTGGALVAVRRYASGLLMCNLHGRGMELSGIRHPDPAAPVDLSTVFPNVPVIELAPWPVARSPLTIQWRRNGSPVPGTGRSIPYA